jgi:hypothetical protein
MNRSVPKSVAPIKRGRAEQILIHSQGHRRVDRAQRRRNENLAHISDQEPSEGQIRPGVKMKPWLPPLSHEDEDPEQQDHHFHGKHEERMDGFPDL